MSDTPDLHFCGFSLWIDGRQFLGASDFWDGNWLMVRASMEASGAHVECEGPILPTFGQLPRRQRAFKAGVRAELPGVMRQSLSGNDCVVRRRGVASNCPNSLGKRCDHRTGNHRASDIYNLTQALFLPEDLTHASTNMRPATPSSMFA